MWHNCYTGVSETISNRPALLFYYKQRRLNFQNFLLWKCQPLISATRSYHNKKQKVSKTHLTVTIIETWNSTFLFLLDLLAQTFKIANSWAASLFCFSRNAITGAKASPSTHDPPSLPRPTPWRLLDHVRLHHPHVGQVEPAAGASLPLLGRVDQHRDGHRHLRWSRFNPWLPVHSHARHSALHLPWDWDRRYVCDHAVLGEC